MVVEAVVLQPDHHPPGHERDVMQRNEADRLGFLVGGHSAPDHESGDLRVEAAGAMLARRTRKKSTAWRR